MSDDAVIRRVIWTGGSPVALAIQMGDEEGILALDALWDHLADERVIAIDPAEIPKSARALITTDGREPRFATIRRQGTARDDTPGRYFVRVDGGSGGAFTDEELRERAFLPTMLPILIARWMQRAREKMQFQRRRL